jgi:hypothetical protein
MRKIIILSSTIVVAIVGLYIGLVWFLNLFNSAPCDGNGPSNGERTYYYDDGKLMTLGSVKDCLWDGLVKTFYETGELKSNAYYKRGKRHGAADYFTKDNVMWRQENFVEGKLTDFQVTDLSDTSSFVFKSDSLKFSTPRRTIAIVFTRPTTLIGFDEPFTSIYNGKLLIRGEQDFYVINKNLEVEMSLRDTLIKYLPKAYLQKNDKSGTNPNFLWHRDISGDSLKLKVFYEGDMHQSNHKIWERTFLLNH